MKTGKGGCYSETALDKPIFSLPYHRQRLYFRRLKTTENPPLPRIASTLKVFVVTHIRSR